MIRKNEPIHLRPNFCESSGHSLLGNEDKVWCIVHVFLIPDGNRRFAKVKHISKADAHMQGAERIKDVIKWCRESKDITQLSVYVLSSDNINKRNDDEVKMLCALCIKELLKLSRLKSDVDGVVVNIVCTYDGYTKVSQLKK